ncbi:MAG: bifunctional transaldolase/phosoglucose isomerase [Dehalococcoidia bacterium]|nr:bifunctional transaldolase/phosoglucose isomerase [Dehalococcoidia bacterium]
MYIEELIGPDTVNTVPPATLNAFRDHGVVSGATVADGVAEAEEVEAKLLEIGIDLEKVGRELEADGVKKFADSFDNLLDGIEEKKQRIQRERSGRFSASFGEHAESVEAAIKELDERDLPRRLSHRDASAWSDDQAVQSTIASRLGWLGVIDAMEDEAARLNGFAQGIKAEGFEHVVLLGMGGSSLAPEVFRQVFGSAAGYPTLHVLDTTDPDAIRAVDQSVDIGRTLFLVSSKSGGTIETATLGDYFWERSGKAGPQFVAITDPDTRLARQASERGYRHTFVNPPNIGGRYSALSYFGLVPAALIGVDVARLLASADQMQHACDHCVSSGDNPGVWLGGALGGLGRKGMDKVTFVLPPKLASFGLWLEQLIAESTGKQGTGLIPVAGEELGAPGDYRPDRVFVATVLEGETDEYGDRLGKLAAAGHPVITLRLADQYDLGGEFFRWEVATAIAGALLKINPFDEPNVQESKDNTARILDRLRVSGSIPEAGSALSRDGIVVYGHGQDPAEAIHHALQGQDQVGYVALMAYMPETDQSRRLIGRLREEIRKNLKTATTVGYGPRFLHSTGQLHKGGPQQGAFVQITTDHADDLEIPGQPFTFGQLQAAQALGDLEALRARGRPVVRIHLGRDMEAGIEEATRTVNEALAGRGR